MVIKFHSTIPQRRAVNKVIYYLQLSFASPVFILQFAFSIIHGSGSKTGENEEGLGTLMTWMMSDGHEVDVGRPCLTTSMYLRASFLPVKWSTHNLVWMSGVLPSNGRSMMKSSVLLNEDPCPPTCNSHLPDSIHVMCVPKPSLGSFCHSSVSLY